MVGSVVITQYAGQPAADAFRRRLQNLDIKCYLHYIIEGYPADVERIVSDEGYGALTKNTFKHCAKHRKNFHITVIVHCSDSECYLHYIIEGYPADVERIVSDEGYGRNDYIETARPLVVVTAPGEALPSRK